MSLDLEQLPQAWLLQFIDLLPNRLRLSLRQCSLGMLQLVDSHSSSCLTWRVLATSCIAVAVQLCAGNVRHLDTSQLPANFTDGLMQAISHRAPSVTESTADAPQLCRRVQKVTGREEQGSIICAAAASTAAGRLKELSVWCCIQCARAFATPAPNPTVTDSAAIVLKCPSAVQVNLLGMHHKFTDLFTDRGGAPVAGEWEWEWVPDDLHSLRCEYLLDGVDDPFCESLSYCLHRWLHIACLELAGDQGGIYMGDPRHPLPQLPHLQRLSINTLLDCDLTTDGLGGLVQCSTLTYVQLTGCLQEFDVQVLSQLPSLQDLSLFSDRTFESVEFRCFTAHNTLSSLSVDSFQLSPVEDTTTATTSMQAQGADAPQAAVSTAAGSTAGQATGAGQQRGGTAVARPPGWSLQSLKRLSVGNLGLAQFLAPVATFAPSLTDLHDSFFDELPCKPVHAAGAARVDALVGLQHLQVLDLDLYTLDRHAGHLTGLTGSSTLQELRLEMCGDMLHESTHLQEGLPRVPSLTKLLMYTKEDVLAADWESRYRCAEDLLLWQQQPQLRELAVCGSCLIGGFLTESEIRAQLPLKLPALQCVSIEQCPDLTVDMLAQLVAVQPAPVVKVSGCKLLTERQCCEVSSASVCVEHA